MAPPSAVRVIASTLFVVAIAFVLSIPLWTADDSSTIEARQFSGPVERAVVLSPHPPLNEPNGLRAVLESGEMNDVPYRLEVAEAAGHWCFRFATGAEIDTHHGLSCSKGGEPAQGRPSLFSPAAANGLGRGVLVAGLSPDVKRLSLAATDGAAISARIYEFPPEFSSEVKILIAFLPPGTDVVSASAEDAAGHPIDVSKLPDQVDPY